MPELNQNADERIIRLNLTDLEWNILADFAKKKNSSSNIRRLVHSELYKFAEKYKSVPHCAIQTIKVSKNFEIPTDIVPFFDNLSNHFDVGNATIVFRLIIMPLILQADCNIIETLIKNY